ncbi:MAG: flagellar hook-basal body complex protein [Dehalococcoidia bacterium]|jgi:flagellar basal body rod protein FlgG
MPTILGAAASGMTHNQDVLDIVGHNIANVNSYAYKKFRPLHEGLPTPQADPDAGRLGVAETTRDLVFSQAATQITENPLHFAIEDDAFVRVRDFDGRIVYTRFGGLESDIEGNILAFKGRPLEPPIQVPEGWTQPAVDQFGVLSAIDDTGTRQEIGQLSLAKFRNPQALETLGDGLYTDTANTGEITVGAGGSEGFAALRPGALEGSNVDVAEEFTNMIIAQRAYTACAKTFSVGDEMLALATKITQ